MRRTCARATSLGSTAAVIATERLAERISMLYSWIHVYTGYSGVKVRSVVVTREDPCGVFSLEMMTTRYDGSTRQGEHLRTLFEKGSVESTHKASCHKVPTTDQPLPHETQTRDWRGGRVARCMLNCLFKASTDSNVVGCLIVGLELNLNLTNTPRHVERPSSARAVNCLQLASHGAEEGRGCSLAQFWYRWRVGRGQV